MHNINYFLKRSVFFILFMMFLDNDLVTIADATDFSHAREYSKNGIVKMIILGKYDVFERTYK